MPVAPLPSCLRPLLRSLPLALALGVLPPAASAAAPFSDNGDGTVTDDSTGLMWDQCVWGQTGALCADSPATTHGWVDALNQAQAANAIAYKGYTDWRPPNLNELESLVVFDQVTQPRFDASVFPNTPLNYFWSSSFMLPLAGSPVSRASMVQSNGGSSAIAIGTAAVIRLVRNGANAAAAHDAQDSVPPVSTEVAASAPANATQAFISVKASERATGYWLVRPAGTAAPTAGELLAGGTAAALLGGTRHDADPGGLTPGTDYVFYFWLRDTAGNGAIAVSSLPFSTPKMAQTITFGGLSDRSFGATVPPLVATASSSLSVVFGSTTPAVCSVTGTSVALLAAGLCTIEATQPGDSTYAAAAPVQQSFTVDAVPPGMPTAAGVVAGDGQAVLTWGAPVSTGGSPVTYTVTGGPGGAQACVSPCVITGLTNGTAYTFTITAGNSAGVGGSTAVGPVTPHLAPVAAPLPIPALSEWALVLLAGGLGLFARGALRRRAA